jgi:thioredoxin-like negative regulator of GroEL
MIERVLLLAVVAVLALVVAVVVRRYVANRQRVVVERGSGVLWQRLGEQPDGRPTVVAFSTPSCAACHRAQAPAISKVVSVLGERAPRVISVDAAAQPDVARAFGVMTVPSTVVLAEAGRVVAINHGFAASQTLIEQLGGA